MELKLNGKSLLGIALLSAGLAFGQYVSLIDAKSSGGIIVQEEAVPVGSIQMWGTSTPPKGWIELNGQSTTPYPQLAALYGSNVPDLRGEFVRGWDNGKGTDSGRSIRTLQNDSVNGSDLSFVGNPLPNHSHGYTRFSVGGTGGNIQWGGDAKRTTSAQTTSGVSAGTPTGTIQGSGDETRPRNIALMYIIKAE